MAISLKPFVGTTATVAAAGTAVAPLLDVPDNCHTVLVGNTSLATIYVGWAPTSGAFVVADAAVIPPNGAAAFGIGPKSDRPATGSAAGVADRLFVDATVNGTVVRLTYVNGMSS